MEVTRKNFNEVLPDVIAAIDAADFLCIDGEFSGLFSGNNINPFDSPSECYQKYRSGSREFLLIQFGLSAFRWDADAESYKHSDFTFYLFPRSESKYALDKIFSCQASSLEFLSKHKFDFNKLIYDGISYMDTTEEIRMRERLQEKQLSEKELKLSMQKSTHSKNNSITIPENFQPRLDEICDQVENFLKNDQEKCVIFENLNGFHRKLAYQELDTRFGKSIHIETKTIDNDKRELVVCRAISEEELKKRLETAHAKEWDDVESLVGFSTVARKISNSNKLVVGHCMILDMLHLLHDFFHPLPEVYEEFKSLTSSLFTNLLDTMHMLKTNTFRDLFTNVDLSSMFTTSSKEPFAMPKIEGDERFKSCSYSLDSNEFHSAGYDAFITGAGLTSLYEYLKSNNPDGIKKISNDVLNAESLLLEPYLNKLFLYKTSFQASPYINVKGEDAKPSRDHVFHLSFPTNWRREDIVDVFESYGGVSVVAFIDNNSAYAALRQHSQAIFVKAANFNSKCVITPFREYKEAIINRPIKSVEDNDKKYTNNVSNQKTTEKTAQKRKISEESEDTSIKIGKRIKENRKTSECSKIEKRSTITEQKQKNTSVKKKRSNSGSKASNVFQVSDNWE